MNNDGNNNRRNGRGSGGHYGERRVNTPGRQTRSHEYDGVVRYRESDYSDPDYRESDYDEYSDSDYRDYDREEYGQRQQERRGARPGQPGRRAPEDRAPGRRDRGRGDQEIREPKRSKYDRSHDDRKSRNSRSDRNVRKSGKPEKPVKSKGRKPVKDDKDIKKSPVKTFFKRLIICISLIVCLCLAIEFLLTKRAYDLMTYEDVTVSGSNVLTSKGVTNILLIGNDSRLGGEDGRSDAMILVSVSKKTGRILMTSILRDVYVEIPGYGHNRLNAAYAFGGPALLMETIEKNFDIPVSKYVLVNFEAFANVVDAVGGIDLELTKDEVIWVDAYLNEYNELTGREFGYDYLTNLEGGMTHLNGPQALAYSRNRYIGTDFGRTERQRKVMEQIIKKLPKAVLTNFNGLIEGLCPNLTTNMTFTEVYSLVVRGPFWLRYDREGAALPIDGTWWNENKDGMAVLGVDFEANRQYFEDRLYVRDEEDADADDNADAEDESN